MARFNCISEFKAKEFKAGKNICVLFFCFFMQWSILSGLCIRHSVHSFCFHGHSPFILNAHLNHGCLFLYSEPFHSGTNSSYWYRLYYLAKTNVSTA